MEIPKTKGYAELVKITEAALDGNKENARKYVKRFMLKYPESDLIYPFTHLLKGDINPSGLGVKNPSSNTVLAGNLLLSKVEEKIEHLIKWNRKICWDADMEDGHFCIGENKLREFVKELKR